MNIVVVEDELTVALQLIKFIKQCNNVVISSLNHFDCLDEAEEYLNEHTIDLLFLDLNLNGLDGFRLLQRQLAQSYHTIVVSANTHRAIDAFEFGVLDFIGKPFSQLRVQKALDRLTEQRSTSHSQRRFLSVRLHGKIELVEIATLAYIRADGNYSLLISTQGKEYLHNKSLDKLSQLLPSSFMRVHKSYIVQIDQIQVLQKLPGSLYRLQLHCDETIPLGRTYYKKLNMLLSER